VSDDGLSHWISGWVRQRREKEESGVHVSFRFESLQLELLEMGATRGGGGV
jgi:hypothetical protein